MDKKVRILVVDDEPDIVLMIRMILEAKGFAVITASDGEEGLQKAIAEKPDLILLDIIMPKKDGFKMLSEIKKDDSVRDIPVILLTAKGETSSLFEAKRFGATDYIIKPVMAQDLLKYIGRYLKLIGKD